MIRLITSLLLLLVCCSQYITSNNFYENSEGCCEVCTEPHSNVYLIYRFGISRIVTVKVEKNEEGYSIFLCDDNDGERCIKTIKERVPVLEWAFKYMPLELENVEYETSDIYSDVYYQLSIVRGDIETIVCSPYLKIVGNKDLIEKVDELKKYIVEIWAEGFLNSQAYYPSFVVITEDHIRKSGKCELVES